MRAVTFVFLVILFYISMGDELAFFPSLLIITPAWLFMLGIDMMVD